MRQYCGYTRHIRATVKRTQVAPQTIVSRIITGPILTEDPQNVEDLCPIQGLLTIVCEMITQSCSLDPESSSFTAGRYFKRRVASSCSPALQWLGLASASVSMGLFCNFFVKILRDFMYGKHNRFSNVFRRRVVGIATRYTCRSLPVPRW